MTMKYKLNDKTKTLYEWSEAANDWQELKPTPVNVVKTLEQKLIEAEDELREYRKGGKKSVQESRSEELREVIQKHNGISDNGGGEGGGGARAADPDGRIALMESFKAMGFSEKEARIGAGIDTCELSEAILGGFTAEELCQAVTPSPRNDDDFWSQLK